MFFDLLFHCIIKLTWSKRTRILCIGYVRRGPMRPCIHKCPCVYRHMNIYVYDRVYKHICIYRHISKYMHKKCPHFWVAWVALVCQPQVGLGPLWLSGPRKPLRSQQSGPRWPQFRPGQLYQSKLKRPWQLGPRQLKRNKSFI